MDGTWSTEDAVAVFGPVVAAGLVPLPDGDDGVGGGFDDVHRDLVLRFLAPQLGAAADAGLDPCRVGAYVRASVGHTAVVIAAGVALTLADVASVPVDLLDDVLAELFEDLARAEDAGLLTPAGQRDAASGGSGGTPRVREAPAVPPADEAVSGAPAVPAVGAPATAGAPAVPPVGGASPPTTGGRRRATSRCRPRRRACRPTRRPSGRAPPGPGGHPHRHPVPASTARWPARIHVRVSCRCRTEPRRGPVTTPTTPTTGVPAW